MAVRTFEAEDFANVGVGLSVEADGGASAGSCIQDTRNSGSETIVCVSAGMDYGLLGGDPAFPDGQDTPITVTARGTDGATTYRLAVHVALSTGTLTGGDGGGTTGSTQYRYVDFTGTTYQDFDFVYEDAIGVSALNIFCQRWSGAVAGGGRVDLVTMDIPFPEAPTTDPEVEGKCGQRTGELAASSMVEHPWTGTFTGRAVVTVESEWTPTLTVLNAASTEVGSGTTSAGFEAVANEIYTIQITRGAGAEADAYTLKWGPAGVYAYSDYLSANRFSPSVSVIGDVVRDDQTADNVDEAYWTLEGWTAEDTTTLHDIAAEVSGSGAEGEKFQLSVTVNNVEQAHVEWTTEGETPSAPVEIKVLYAVPSDVTSASRHSNGDIADWLDEMQTWLDSESSSASEFQFAASVELVDLDSTLAAINTGDPGSTTFYSVVHPDLEAQGYAMDDPLTKYLVFLETGLPVVDWTPAVGAGGSPDSWAVLVDETVAPGSPLYRIAIHEFFHNLGAVPSQAPHASGVAHVSYVPGVAWADQDIMVGPAGYKLDVGRDDYYGHSGDWLDIADSPFLGGDGTGGFRWIRIPGTIDVVPDDVVAFKMWQQVPVFQEGPGFVRLVVYYADAAIDCSILDSDPGDDCTGGCPDDGTDPSPGVSCEEDPTDPNCLPSCTDAPDDPNCIPSTDFCIENPDHPNCVPTDEYCAEHPDDPSCNGCGQAGADPLDDPCAPPTPEPPAESDGMFIVITSPLDGATLVTPPERLSATVTVTGEMTVATVEFLIGAQLIGEAESMDPYTFDWDWTDFPPGTYTLWARATSTTNVRAVSAYIEITIADTEDPVVTFLSPPADTVSGIVAVSVLAEDNDPAGVETVEYTLDGTTSIGTATLGPPWLVMLDTSQLSAGGHTIDAVATDPSANTGTASRSFTVGSQALDALTPEDYASWPDGGVKVEIDFDNDPQSVTETWTNVTTDVLAVSISRGRGSELEVADTGELSLTLRNVRRQYEPYYAAGDYYPNVIPMRRVRVTAEHDSTTYHLFRGFIERWPQTYPSFRRGTVQVTAVDSLFPIRQAEVVADLVAQITGQRITAVLDLIAWPATLRDIDAGRLTVRAETLLSAQLGETDASLDALPHLQAVAQSELGLLFGTADGKVAFHDRDHRASALRSVVSQATFGDGGLASGELSYEAPTIDFDVQRVFNDIHVTREGQSEQSAEDTASQALYWKRTLREAVLLASRSAARQHARSLLAAYKDPRLRVDTVGLNPTRHSAYWAAVLPLEISDRVTVVRRPQDPDTAAPIRLASYVEKIEHDIQAGQRRTWTVRLTLSQPPPPPGAELTPV